MVLKTKNLVLGWLYYDFYWIIIMDGLIWTYTFIKKTKNKKEVKKKKKNEKKNESGYKPHSVRLGSRKKVRAWVWLLHNKLSSH